MKSSTKSYLIFFIAVILLLYGIQSLFDYQIPKNINRKPYWILSKEKGEYDFVILGSSRTYSGIIPDTVAKYTNSKNVINLSLDGTSYAEQYLVFREFCNKNKVRNLILLADIYSLDNSFLSYPFHEYYYLPIISSEHISEIIKGIYPAKYYFWKYVPYFKYAEFNDRIGVGSFITSFIGPKNTFDNTKGFFPNNITITNTQINNLAKYFPDRQIKIDTLSFHYFNEIVDLCLLKDIKITFVEIPEYIDILEYHENRDVIISKYESISKQNNIPNFRIFDTNFYSNKLNFANLTHLNVKGANEFTMRLIEFISSNDE